MSSLPPLSTRLLQVSCAVVWCFFAAGPVFGFAALKPILINEDIYGDQCKKGSSKRPCNEQDLSLNLLFTVACMVTNISALPVGSILDLYGPKITGIIGLGLLLIASIFLQFASLMTYIDGYLFGYTLLALSGPFVFIPCFQLANSFPKNSGLILAILTGAFDSSLALFLMYRLIYTNIKKIPLSIFFKFYMLVPLFIFVCQLTIMPLSSYKTIGTLAKIAETGIDETGRPINKDLLLPSDAESAVVDQNNQQPSITETTQLLMSSHRRRSSVMLRMSTQSTKSVYEQDADSKMYESTGGVFGVLHESSIMDQMQSPWFYLMALFTTIQMLRINYFVATVRSQELFLYHGDEAIAKAINEFFDLALPIGGLLSIPFIGLILDNLTTLTTLWILLGVSVTIGVMGLLSWIPGTYLGIILLVMYRPFYYTAVSDFCAKVFGYNNFGTIYGTIISFSGICNILQQFMDKATHEYFNLNPIPVNSILTLLTIVFGLMLVFYVRSQELNLKRKRLEIEAQEAPARYIPH